MTKNKIWFVDVYWGGCLWHLECFKSVKETIKRGIEYLVFSCSDEL